MSVSVVPTFEAPRLTQARRCKGCGCHLSRYNDETSCAACIRQACQPPMLTQTLAHVWSDARVQQALVMRDFGTFCVLVRRLGGLRQEDLAGLTGLGQSFLSMLESGVRRLTNINKITMMLDGLDVPIELTGPMLRTSSHPTPLHAEPSGSSGQAPF